MYKTAPCYSKNDYYGYFDVDFTNKKILDIGSSVGSFVKSRKFGHSARSIDAGAADYTTMDINPKSGADIIGDAHKLPFEDNQFDIILANNVVEHFYSPVLAVSEMYRVLKKGGIIYFTVPFLYPVHEAPHDYVRYTRYGLDELFKDFSDVEIFARGGLFSNMANLMYKPTHLLDKFYLGAVCRFILYPFLYIYVQLDRFDNTEAFVRSYFGSAKK